MRRMRMFVSLAMLVLASLLPGLAPAAEVQDTNNHVLRVDWGEFPETLDPQKSDEGQWSVSGGIDYEGLTRIDEELQVAPGAAESWQFRPDGMAITYHLREGLVYSDGVPVTAADFVYAAERICSPEVSSLSVDLLADVIGCLDLNTSGGDANAAAKAREEFGVRALDDRTIEYRFTRPAPYFPASAALWATIPLRQELVEQGGPTWWTNPATRIGNGPFRLVEYTADGSDSRVRYARNENYWGGSAKLDKLDFRFLDDDQAMAAYQRGDIDVIYPGDQNTPALEADPVLSRELVRIPDAGTFYYIFNATREPFQDKQIRRAFSAAFDREDYCRDLKFGSCTPTLSMIPLGMPAAIETDDLAFDPEKARQELAASSYGGPERLPEIDRHEAIDDPESATVATWFYEQYRQVLGVELTRVPLAEDDYDALFADLTTVPQFHSSSWFANLDPRGWFTIWRCDSPFNDHGYCNPKLDKLLDRADAEMDPEQRAALYEDAGRMLVDDAPAIFVSNVSTMWLVKPDVTGYTRVTGINGDWPGWMNLMTVDVEWPET